MSEISERLLKILSDNDISYGELSAKTSIPKSALQRYATGQTEKIPIARLEMIAKTIGTTPGILMGWEKSVSSKSLDMQDPIKEVLKMPVLSAFYGIIVRMYQEKGGKHNMPHIHAEFSGDEVVLSLDGTVLEGSIPKNKLKLLEAWIVIHHDDLEANWKLLSDGEQFFRIDPLK